MALNQFGLQALRDRSPLTLSGGEQQKLVLAAILARQPELVVFDEPLSMLDTTAACDLLEAIQQLIQAGKAIMIFEHRHEYLQQVAGLQFRVMESFSNNTFAGTLLELRRNGRQATFQLAVRELSVQLDVRKILDGLDFEAQGGQIIAVVGPNGAGKTTLLRALAGFQAYSGRVVIEAHGRQ